MTQVSPTLGILKKKNGKRVSTFQANTYKLLLINLSSLFFVSDKTIEEQTVSDQNTVISSPKMISLWKRAVESSKAVILEELDLTPDVLLEKVEEFEGTSQAAEHTFTALVLPGNDGAEDYVDDEDRPEEYSDIDDDFDDECSDDDESFEPVGPEGSLPVDKIVRKLREKLK